MSTTTPRFGITVPDTSDLSNWAAILVATFGQLETTVGVNGNLVLEGDDSEGAAAAGDLAFLSTATQFQAVDAGSSRWGRAVLQEALSDGDPALLRFLGITAVSGTPGAFGSAVFHAAGAAGVVSMPKDAVVAIANRVHFLPLGMSLGGGTILMNGLFPLQVCPIVGATQGTPFQDGTGAPSASGWGQSFNNGEKRFYWESQFDGAGQDNDIVFPFALPSNFGEFPDVAGADFWGFQVDLRCNDNSSTGNAGAQITAFIDSAGTSFASLGTALSHSASWTSQKVSWQSLAALGAVLTPGSTVLLRVRTQGNNTDTVDISNPRMQFFPAWRWN